MERAVGRVTKHELELTSANGLHRVSCVCGWHRWTAYYTESAARAAWEHEHLQWADPAKYEALGRLRTKIREEAT